jgi:RNA polymerase sigma factor (sigma-70 family)
MNPEELFEQHMYLAEVTVHKMFDNPDNIAKKNGMEKSDLYQYAYTGLFKAVKSWDETKGRNFKNFAITNIRWELLRRLRDDTQFISGYSEEAKKFRRNGIGILSMDKEVDINNDEGLTLHELIGSNYDLLDEVVTHSIEEMIPERTMEFVKRKLNGETLREIAKDYGITHQAVDANIKSFGKKLRRVI